MTIQNFLRHSASANQCTQNVCTGQAKLGMSQDSGEVHTCERRDRFQHSEDSILKGETAPDVSTHAVLATLVKFALFAVSLVLLVFFFSIFGRRVYVTTSHPANAAASFRLTKAYNEALTQPVPLSIRPYHTIIIDAGHGGEDGGAQSSTGINEKDINLKIALYLKEFMSLCDYDVHLTREDDVLLYEPGQESRKKYHDLRNRVAFANQFDDAIFVSIHQNKFTIPKYKGFQVYYSKNHADSKGLADLMQKNVVQNLQPDNNRVTKAAGKEILVLDTLEMPAVLAECGFLSNDEEAHLLDTTEYQKKLAFLLFRSIVEFMNGE